jgi:hypothetical protein
MEWKLGFTTYDASHHRIPESRPKHEPPQRKTQGRDRDRGESRVFGNESFRFFRCSRSISPSLLPASTSFPHVRTMYFIGPRKANPGQLCGL